MIAPSDIFRASDGKWVALEPTGERFWRKFCKAIDRPQLVEDARFVDATARITHVQELTTALAGVIALRTSAEWLAVFKGSTHSRRGGAEPVGSLGAPVGRWAAHGRTCDAIRKR